MVERATFPMKRGEKLPSPYVAGTFSFFPKSIFSLFWSEKITFRSFDFLSPFVSVRDRTLYRS